MEDDLERFLLDPKPIQLTPDRLSVRSSVRKGQSSKERIASIPARRTTIHASPTASLSSDWNDWNQPSKLSSDEEDEDVDLTASQIDRHSLANLLRADRSLKEVVIPESPEVPHTARRPTSEMELECDSDTSPPRRQIRNPSVSTNRKQYQPCHSPNNLGRPPSVANTSGSRSTNTRKQTDSLNSRRTWSIPSRPRESRRTEDVVSLVPDSPTKVTHSTPSPIIGSQCLISPEITRELSPSDILPSPIVRPPLEPFRPSAIQSPRSIGSPLKQITSTPKKDKGKGRQIDPTPPMSPVNLSRVLAPDSSDTPEKDRVCQIQENLEEYQENEDLDDLSHLDYEQYERNQDEAGEDHEADLRPPSPGVSSIGPSSRYFHEHLIASQESIKSRGSMRPPPSPTESEKRNRLLRDLGFDDEGEIVEDDQAAFSSSPIEVIQGPKASTSKPRKAPKSNLFRASTSDIEDQNDDDDEAEITIVRNTTTSLVRAARQSPEEQLRCIGIVVDDEPSQGLAPLMTSWPPTMRNIFRKMAGLSISKGKGRELLVGEINEEEQIQAWQTILAKQQKKATSNSSSSFNKKRKTWYNSSVWKSRKKARHVKGPRRAKTKSK